MDCSRIDRINYYSPFNRSYWNGWKIRSYDCKNQVNSYDFLRIERVHALFLSVSLKPNFVVIASLFPEQCIFEFSVPCHGQHYFRSKLIFYSFHTQRLVARSASALLPTFLAMIWARLNWILEYVVSTMFPGTFVKLIYIHFKFAIAPVCNHHLLLLLCW